MLGAARGGSLIMTGTALTAQDRHRIGLARKLASPGTISGLRAEADTDDTVVALAHFWGAARVTITYLIDIIERLTGDDGGQDGSEEDRDG